MSQAGKKSEAKGGSCGCCSCAGASVAGGGGLDELDEDAAGVLGVDEVDAAVGGAALRLVVEESQPALAQGLAHGVDVLDAVGDLLDAGSGAVEELRDGRLGGERREQLD